MLTNIKIVKKEIPSDREGTNKFEYVAFGGRTEMYVPNNQGADDTLELLADMKARDAIRLHLFDDLVKELKTIKLHAEQMFGPHGVGMGIAQALEKLIAKYAEAKIEIVRK